MTRLCEDVLYGIKYDFFEYREGKEKEAEEWSLGTTHRVRPLSTKSFLQLPIGKCAGREHAHYGDIIIRSYDGQFEIYSPDAFRNHFVVVEG